MEVSCIMAKVVTVISGKGGAGKTLVAVNLSCALKKLGYRVFLCDCSFGIRNDDIPLGQTSDGLYNISDVLKGIVSLDEALITNKDFRPDFLRASAETCPDEFEESYSKIISSLSQSYDYIVIDTPSSSGREFDLCTKLADIVLAVTGDDYLSVSNTALCVNRIDSSNREIYCIINRVLFSQTENSVSAEEVADEIGCTVTGIIAEDIFVPESLDGGEPIVRYNTYAGRELENLAKRICKMYVSPQEANIGERMFDRNRKVLKNN